MIYFTSSNDFLWIKSFSASIIVIFLRDKSYSNISIFHVFGKAYLCLLKRLFLNYLWTIQVSFFIEHACNKYWTSFFLGARALQTVPKCLDAALNDAKNQTCLKLYLKPESSTHHRYFWPCTGTIARFKSCWATASCSWGS